MASLPPQSSARRRSFPRESSSPEASRAVPRSSSRARSTTSEDSQTVLLNSYTADEISSSTQSQQGSSGPQQTPNSSQKADADEPRKCWICMNDETEDTPESSEWRSPCQCALVAHESCLLDWVADLESPTSRRRTGGSGKIECPQCKSEIVLARPRSYVIDAVRAVERIGGVLMIPGACFVGAYTIYQGCLVHGVSTVYAIFGLEDGSRILGPLYAPLRARDTQSVLLATLKNSMRNLRLDIGLSLIPITLVAARTTLADSILPILPMLFFATSPQSDEILKIGHWPPSAALSVAMLPYLRAAYNTYYEHVWAPKERKWLKSIQPRAGDAQAGTGEGDQDDDVEGQLVPDDGDGVVELNIDLNIIEEFVEHEDAGDDDQEQQQQPNEQEQGGEQQVPGIERGPAPPLHQPPLDVAEAEAAPQNHPPVPPPPRQWRREENVLISTTRIADTVLGALIFPSVAAAVGELLRVSLPLSWIRPQAGGRPTGMLQTRWGRSLIGGCLFVAVKDAVMLYVRWKMAQNHRKRRVLDYDKAKGKVVRPRGS